MKTVSFSSGVRELPLLPYIPVCSGRRPLMNDVRDGLHTGY